MTRRFCLAFIPAMLASILATATTTLAEETGDADTAAFVGTALVFPAVGFAGGGGNFSFASSTCTLASASGLGGEAGEPTPDAELPPTSTCSVNASGTYANIVCGTGIAAGTGSLTEGAGSDSYAAQFSIFFTAGVGTLLGVATESEPDGGGVAGAQPVVGTAVLIPEVDPLPPAGMCFDQFTVAVSLTTTA